ncbi:PREDICTED: cytochrome c oxidase subunit 7C, mitochondrial [Tinamus guttatus]|uniref:cytochrome c oxidase subunit 7C, mitochondrial n=1 Tax=Tinamus guttatus TaxID=94827 RepID=UPI00052E8096|nr:PREDICTED: cytochrome c oxidase subunit 7C, mitochondrial [Tinamus guttatus]
MVTSSFNIHFFPLKLLSAAFTLGPQLFPFAQVPFSIENKWRLLAVMCAFFGSGFAAPFFIVRHQLLKK